MLMVSMSPAPTIRAVLAGGSLTLAILVGWWNPSPWMPMMVASLAISGWLCTVWSIYGIHRLAKAGEVDSWPPERAERQHHDRDEATRQLQVLDQELLGIGQRLAAGTVDAQATTGMASFGACQGVAQIESLNTNAEAMSRSIATLAANGRHMAEQVGSAAEIALSVGSTSAEVTKLAKNIANLAWRTRLLALNAAIEAARAGDAGRGFSVVASEVRVLAQRSAEAAADIEQTVINLGPKMAQLESSTTAAKTAAQGIAEAVEQQAATAAEMAQVIKETGDGLGCISTGLEQLTGQSDRLAEETKQVESLAQRIADLTRRLGAAAHDPDPLPVSPLPEAIPS